MENKTVIVTGGARGIGREVTTQLCSKGYNVLINYNKSEQIALDLALSLKEEGRRVEVFKADISKRCEVDNMVEYCMLKFNSVDILINNAGIAQSRLFTDITMDDWKRMIDVNLTGTFNCIQSVLPQMINKKEGKIINISSIWGMVGASCEVHYSAAKAGIIGLTKALAKELGPSNITVNCIAPGVINTEMLSGYSEKEMKELETEIPVKRLGEPSDVANLVTFLASESSSYITGQIISPNGGFVI